jgi:hypothetical protein
MRKITKEIKQAFDERRPLAIGNTTTDGNRVWLHGNLIIKREGDKVLGTLAGWNTPTTRERLNGITSGSWTQQNWEPFHNGKPIRENEWK